MKLRGKICLLLSVVLLLNGLMACRQETVEEEPSPPPATAVPDSAPPVETDSADTQEEEEEEEEIEETVDEDSEAVWDPDYQLPLAFTPVPAGQLELPVQGATGYASVKLPLWKQIPGTSATTMSAAMLSTTLDPAPDLSPGPTPEPLPELTPEPTPESTPEPTPTPEPEPTPEPAPDEVVQTPPPEATASPLPEAANSSGEQTPEASATPSPDPYAGALAVLAPGTAFTILKESGSWWLVQTKSATGWVEHRYCLINLPDVIPSIVYHDTNSDASLFVSSGKAIPGITGQALYSCKTYNPRLGREEYLMPVLYSMAKRICQAQQTALSQGNTLVLYESYRPYKAQQAVVQAMQALASKDPEVKAGISTPPWSISWFIATGYSNHQRGFAIDVSLAKVLKAETGHLGGHSFVQVRSYKEYTMPTQIHELSMAAATFTTAVSSLSSAAWKSAKLSPTMDANEPAKALQRCCTGAGLTPLASEWWHFNDLQTRAQVADNLSTGGYLITECRSVSVQSAQAMA